MQKNVMIEDGIPTYILRRKPIEVSPNQGEAPQVHLCSTSDALVFHGPTLKKGRHSLQEDSLQDKQGRVCKMAVCKVTICKMTVCKMTVCKMTIFKMNDIST